MWTTLSISLLYATTRMILLVYMDLFNQDANPLLLNEHMCATGGDKTYADSGKLVKIARAELCVLWTWLGGTS